MKKLLFFAALLMASAASAQSHYQDNANVDMLRHHNQQSRQRREIILPEVNGFTVYKADLHTHSIFSDGSVTPEFRVEEAWLEGLDVLAITEHLEYRPYEQKMVNFLNDLLPEGTKATNTNIIGTGKTDKDGIKSDLNYPVRLAEAAAKGYGLTIIPGIEITRTPETIGHFNALFTKDNNTIHDSDPMQAFRNARAQGALVMNNHPGWRRKNLDMSEPERKAYAEKLIDGVEVMNGGEFYPRVIDYALEQGVFIASNTDINGSSAEEYFVTTEGAVMRNMTFILAKDNSLESLKEALKARRTLAYSFGTIAGEESLLKAFFKASIATKVVYTNPSNGNRTVRLTNTSSIPYTFRIGGGNITTLKAFSSVQTTVAKDGKLVVKVENMWSGKDSHPEVELTF
ncbi:MAG: histidinol-phosphatase [Alistipes sp.]|nr:histidinol-phosphatase [Alistipes sp.]